MDNMNTLSETIQAYRFQKCDDRQLNGESIQHVKERFVGTVTDRGRVGQGFIWAGLRDHRESLSEAMRGGIIIIPPIDVGWRAGRAARCNDRLGYE